MLQHGVDVRCGVVVAVALRVGGQKKASPFLEAGFAGREGLDERCEGTCDVGLGRNER
jgi:hypothetical protein